MSADGRTLPRLRRARRRWNVIKLVTIMLVETVSKVDAAATRYDIKLSASTAEAMKRAVIPECNQHEVCSMKLAAYVPSPAMVARAGRIVTQRYSTQIM